MKKTWKDLAFLCVLVVVKIYVFVSSSCPKPWWPSLMTSGAVSWPLKRHAISPPTTTTLRRRSVTGFYRVYRSFKGFYGAYRSVNGVL